MKATLVLSVFLTIVTLRGMGAQTVTQPEDHISVFEGDFVQVKCNYSYAGSPVLFWYVQYPRRSLQLLLKHVSGESIKGFTASLNRDETSFHLKKQSAQEEDSATYYCALRDHMSTGYQKLIFGTGTQLLISPNITDPDPAVYQLKSPKSSKTSVCLFTDFDSEKKMPQSQEGTVIMSNGTVLDMRVMDSKSNGVLAWSNSTDFKCNSTFNEKFYSSSDFSCNATLIEKSFETDMNLNAHNLLVMGLRVLLLKVAGFNLFVTLRLWSR